MTIDTQQVGLLFVHGVGEQPRFEHLRTSVRELAELLLRTLDDSSISIVDRTEDWPHRPGIADPAGTSMMTMTLTTPTGRIVYECNEVWWADLGCRSGLFDTVTFWLWGLGQWAAPIYRAMDAARVGRGQGIVTLPRSVSGRFWEEAIARARLFKAALAALFVLVTWSLAKRVFEWLGGAPSPTLIVRYVGDVRTYEVRATPGDSSPQDPGLPRRVGIRRRMVTEMVAMGSKDLDQWWVLAHSLGTVVAYNGIGELGHTLPNYLPKEQWEGLSEYYKTDPGCQRRSGTATMMPARPSWLETADVINRPRLFENLKGLVTYGSPLDKFAGLWPRIVATATDRTDGAPVFPNTHWLNVAAPQDPVSGMLRRFRAAPGEALAGAIPQVSNVALPFDPLYGLAHLRYFAPAEAGPAGRAEAIRRSIAAYLAGGAVPQATSGLGFPARLLLVHLPYFAIIAFLWLLASALVAAVLGLADAFLGQEGGVSSLFDSGRFRPALGEVAWNVLKVSALVLAAALAVIGGFGLWRWFRESRLNLRLAEAERDRYPSDAAMPRQVQLASLQSWAGLVLLVLGAAAFGWGVWTDYQVYSDGQLPRWRGAMVGALTIAAAIAVQSLINKKGVDLPEEPGT